MIADPVPNDPIFFHDSQTAVFKNDTSLYMDDKPRYRVYFAVAALCPHQHAMSSTKKAIHTCKIVRRLADLSDKSSDYV